jgi:NADPH-dependent glutamate synthase beta subunit-like oxidoreductase
LVGFRKALETIKKEIPLFAVVCWVCFHHDRGEIEKPEAVKILRHAVNDYKTSGEAPLKSSRKQKKVAIIGSGPAGLTAATELLQKGYAVTIFESSSAPGGMLRKCMPKYRLPQWALDAEIEHLTKLGVQVKTDTTVGQDLTIKGLLQGEFKAVFIATGAHKSRKLKIEGANLEGVIDALDFLWEVNSEKKPKVGNKVAVVGGGNVAVDAARTARRLEAKEVSILYRRSREEMPANPWEVEEAEKEGVKLQLLVSPRRILGKNGRVSALECVNVTLGELDETGRRRPIPIEGSESQKEIDTLVIAIGETPDLSFLPKEIEVTEKNTIDVDPFTLETSMPGVFAGGDVVLGPATVIEAIVAGKRAAVSIDRYLEGRDIKTGEKMPIPKETHVK